MKNLRTILATMLLLCCTTLCAHGFEVDGIYYNILSKENKTVVVTSHKDADSKPSKRYSGDIKIPSTVTYKKKEYKVVAIESKAFYDCEALKSVIIPSCVTSIGEYAFYGCPSSLSVHIEDLSAWCKMKADLPSLHFYNLYLNGELLTEIVIPDDITEIKSFPFAHNNNITSVKLHDGVTKIASLAFSGCKKLASIEIPNSVRTIGTLAFANCEALEYVTLPENVEVERNSFKACDNLKIAKVGEKTFSKDVFLSAFGGANMNKTEQPEFSGDVNKVVEKEPEFPGGTPALMRFLKKNIQYPALCRKNNVQGKAYVNFTIKIDGTVCDARILKSSGSKLLDKEAIRVIMAMPKWVPGMQNGKNVAVEYTLPVTFRLLR